ncbi:MAG: hypothetical protein ACKO3R_07585 [bacterium]
MDQGIWQSLDTAASRRNKPFPKKRAIEPKLPSFGYLLSLEIASRERVAERTSSRLRTTKTLESSLKLN